MKRLSLIVAGLLLGAWPMLAALAAADQDLEVTMEVIDNVSQLDGVISEMPGPRLGEFDEERDERPPGDSPAAQLTRDDGSPDPFEHDDMDDEAHERAMQSEGDFEEGEDVDDERFEIEGADDDLEEEEHDKI